MRLRRGFSVTDLLIVIAVLGILIALLLPALGTVRESARRSTCMANLKQSVLAIKTYEEQRRTYPPSAYYTTVEDGETYVKGKISAVVPGSAKKGDTRAPYSVYVKLLPYIEYSHIYDELDFTTEAFDEANADYAASVIPLLICPSYAGSMQSAANEYEDIGELGLTNYKPLSATTWPVLNDAENVKGKDGDGGILHPYGVTRAAKATSLTLLFCETKEETYAAWYDGTTTGIPGFQPSIDKGKKCTTPALNFRAPEHDTFLSKDDFGGATEMEWGPSSEHAGLVIHSIADGSARAIASDIDAKIYAALITRRASDNQVIGKWLGH